MLCPWPVEEQRDSAAATRETDVFQQFQLMACIRDMFEGEGSGVFQQIGRVDGTVFAARR